MNDKKYNVLMVHNYYQLAGGEDSVFKNEKKLLEEHGHKVYTYTRNNNEIKKMVFLKKIFLPIITIFNCKTYYDIKKIIKKRNIDIVHVHNTLNLISPSVFYAANKMGVPVVQTIHNFRMLCPNGLFYRNNKICEDCISKGLKCSIRHKCYRNSKLQTIIIVIMMKLHRLTGIYRKIHYICLTDFNKDKLLKSGQILNSQIFVKPNYVDNYSKKIISRDKRRNQYIFVGRLDENKGIKDLLLSWNKMPGENKLLVFGNGPLFQWCNEFIKNNNLSNVKMMGFQPQEIIKTEMARSKALIMPSKWYEGFPMTFLESLSTGTPVITNEIGNCGILVINGTNGYKFSSLSLDIEDAINSINNNISIYESTICNFNTLYSKSNNYNTLIKIYKEIEDEKQ